MLIKSAGLKKLGAPAVASCLPEKFSNMEGPLIRERVGRSQVSGTRPKNCAEKWATGRKKIGHPCLSGLETRDVHG
jgi:hypothetical protein